MLNICRHLFSLLYHHEIIFRVHTNHPVLYSCKRKSHTFPMCKTRDFIQSPSPSLHLAVVSTPPEAFILRTLKVWVNYGRRARFSSSERFREMFPYHESYFHPLFQKAKKRLQSLKPLAFHVEYLTFTLGD